MSITHEISLKVIHLGKPKLSKIYLHLRGHQCIPIIEKNSTLCDKFVPKVDYQQFIKDKHNIGTDYRIYGQFDRVEGIDGWMGLLRYKSLYHQNETRTYALK